MLVKTTFLKKIVFSPLSFPKAQFGQDLSRENLAKFAFHVGFGLISSAPFNTFFSFSEQALQSWNCILLELGMQIHISPLPAFHIQEIFAFWTQRVGDEVIDSKPFRYRLRRCNTTTHLCTVTFYREATSRNINMPPPTPPLHDLRNHICKNVRFRNTVFGPLA